MKDKWYQRLMWIVIGAVILAFLSPILDSIKSFADSNSNFIWLLLASLAIGVIIGGIIWLLIHSETAQKGLGCIITIVIFICAMFACQEAQTLWNSQIG